MGKHVRQPDFVSGQAYHIVNHANGFEDLFLWPSDYRYWLKNFRYRVQPVAEILSYNLLSNHFHIVLRPRPEEVLDEYLREFERRRKRPYYIPTKHQGARRYHYLVGRQLANFLNGYSKGFNRLHNRRGKLILPTTRRFLIDSRSYLKAAIRYVNANAVHHRIVKSIYDHEHSSFHSHFKPGWFDIPTGEIEQLFGGREKFIQIHEAAYQKPTFVVPLEPPEFPVPADIRIISSL